MCQHQQHFFLAKHLKTMSIFWVTDLVTSKKWHSPENIRKSLGLVANTPYKMSLGRDGSRMIQNNICPAPCQLVRPATTGSKWSPLCCAVRQLTTKMERRDLWFVCVTCRLLSISNDFAGLACHCWCYTRICKYILTFMFGSCWCFWRNASISRLLTLSSIYLHFCSLVCQPMPCHCQTSQLVILAASEFRDSTSWGLKVCKYHFLNPPQAYYTPED